MNLRGSSCLLILITLVGIFSSMIFLIKISRVVDLIILLVSVRNWALISSELVAVQSFL